jgi:hypothetical protein
LEVELKGQRERKEGRSERKKIEVEEMICIVNRKDPR